MKIARGKTRIVFIFKYFVIKLPVINLQDAVKVFKDEGCYNFKKFREDGFKKHYQKILADRVETKLLNQECTAERSKKFGLKMSLYKRYEMDYTISSCLLAGIMANWNEFTFYQRTRNSFLVPTYFSLLGWFNIQKKVEPITFWSGDDIWRYISDNSQNINQPFCSSHTFAEINNFGLDEGYLKIIDYGGHQVNSFLEVNGKKFFNNFVKPPE